jgi:hypothetical protein
MVSASISRTSRKLALMMSTSCLNFEASSRTTSTISDADAATTGRRSRRSHRLFSSTQVKRKIVRGTSASSVCSSTPSAARCTSPSAQKPKRRRSEATTANQ